MSYSCQGVGSGATKGYGVREKGLWVREKGLWVKGRLWTKGRRAKEEGATEYFEL